MHLYSPRKKLSSSQEKVSAVRWPWCCCRQCRAPLSAALSVDSVYWCFFQLYCSCPSSLPLSFSLRFLFFMMHISAINIYTHTHDQTCTQIHSTINNTTTTIIKSDTGPFHCKRLRKVQNSVSECVGRQHSRNGSFQSEKQKTKNSVVWGTYQCRCSVVSQEIKEKGGKKQKTCACNDKRLVM